jgi:hypothetical protein
MIRKGFPVSVSSSYTVDISGSSRYFVARVIAYDHSTTCRRKYAEFHQYTDITSYKSLLLPLLHCSTGATAVALTSDDKPRQFPFKISFAAGGGALGDRDGDRTLHLCAETEQQRFVYIHLFVYCVVSQKGVLLLACYI